MGIKRTMYFLIATLALLFFTFAAQGEEKPFITKWKGEAGKELKIPIWGKNYKLVIKKASDNTVLKTESALTITRDNFYQFTPTEDGELLIEAGSEGVEDFFYYSSNKEFAEPLLEVQQFGNVVWHDICFANCKNMKFATGIDVPDLTKAEYICFSGCLAFNYDLGSWDVSNCYNVDLSPSGISTENYSKSLIAWANKADKGKPKWLVVDGFYFNASAKEARNKLIYERNWLITDDCPEGGKKYELLIGRLQLNTDNTQNLTHSLQQMGILKRGSIQYEHTEKEVILTLEDVELLAKDSTSNDLSGKADCAIWYGDDSKNLKLKIKGNCKLVGKLEGGKDCSLSIIGNSLEDTFSLLDFGGEISANEVYINNCSVEARGFRGITAHKSIIIDNANVRAKGRPNGIIYSILREHSLVALHDIILKGCDIVKPEGAYVGKFILKESGREFEYKTVLDQKGEPVKTDWVEILKKSSPDNAVEDPIFASVLVSPNPFNTLLRISNGDVCGKYTLYNTQGVEVALGALDAAETRINTISFPAGLYLLRLTAENGATKTFTVVKR